MTSRCREIGGPRLTPVEQRQAAIVKANEVRRARLELKDGLRAGTITLDDILLAGPHPAVLRTPLLDVMMWGKAGRLQSRGLAILGERALDARVNLLLPVGQASVRMRAWCVAHADSRRMS